MPDQEQFYDYQQGAMLNVSTHNPLPVNEATDFLTDGTKTVTTTPTELAATFQISKVYVQNDPNSTVNVLVGSSTSQSIKLVPGAGMEIEINDLAKVFVKSASATATVNYLAGGRTP